jgi:hypothetical protein
MSWRRVASTCGLILLGAGATGIGMGTVLFHARTERDTLKEHVRAAEAQIASLQNEHTRLMSEASVRVTKAEETRQATQQELETLLRAQELLTSAPTLPPPDARLRRSWNETISVPLGISLRTPAFAPATANDQSLTATINGTAQTAGDLWLSLTRFTPDGERSLVGQLNTTSSARYRIGNRLLIGARGTFQTDRSIAYVLRIEQNGTPEQLIWVRAISPLTESRLLEILSTLTFAS